MKLLQSGYRTDVPRFSLAKRAVAAEASSWRTLKQPQTTVLEVKKSKFVATAWPITAVSQAEQYITGHKDLSASHNCYAYKLSQEQRASDDGEPSGTAGQPILIAINAENLNGVCVLVTRHFGGTKLGTGGLARAYGGAARECLRLAGKVVFQRQATLCMQVPFDSLGAVYIVLNKHNAHQPTEHYLASGEMEIHAEVAEAVVSDIQRDMLNATSGAVKPRLV